MTFTYSLASLDLPVAQVRTRIGDTIKGQKMLDDEEIERVMTEEGLALDASMSDSQANSVALTACKRALVRLTRDIDRSNIGMSASRSQKIENLKEVCKMLGDDLAAAGAAPVATGTSIGRKESINSDADFTGAKIERGQNEIPGTSRRRNEWPD